MAQITKEKFIEMYEKMAIVDMASELGCSEQTIYNWRDKLNLPKKRIPLLDVKEKGMDSAE